MTKSQGVSGRRRVTKSQGVWGRKRAVAEPDRSTGDVPVYCHDPRAAALSLPNGAEFELKPGLNFVPSDYWERWNAQHDQPTAATVFEIGPRPNEPDWVRDNKSEGTWKDKFAKMSKARYLEPLGKGKFYEAWLLLNEDVEAFAREDGSADEEAVELLCTAFAAAQRAASLAAAGD
jgi:hypothetical protein